MLNIFPGTVIYYWVKAGKPFAQKIATRPSPALQLMVAAEQ